MNNVLYIIANSNETNFSSNGQLLFFILTFLDEFTCVKKNGKEHIECFKVPICKGHLIQTNAQKDNKKTIKITENKIFINKIAILLPLFSLLYI